MGSQMTFDWDGGQSTWYEAVPKSGTGPAVIVLQEWWGLVPHIKQVCDQLAAQQFVAIAPDLYHGHAAKNPDEAGRLMMALNIERAADEIGAAIRYLGMGHRKVSEKKIGIIGFCMGGQLAVYAASKFLEIGACVDFYGVHPKIQVDYSKIKCPVMGFFAEKDSHVPPETARKLESQLNTHGVKTDFHVFPGVEHAFFNDSRPEVYHQQTAQKAWERMLAFLRNSLKAEVAQ
ncbi:MAG: dienelactone hydrolase family protein [Elusimicrobia bacterium]|nr:dienelactone hydrolase family protein [Elusimicrobiota bacterium]